MGEAFFGDKKHFVDGGTCSLEILREGVQAPQPRQRSRIDRVHLLAFEAVTGSATISGKASDVDAFNRSFPALEFKEARLRLFFRDGDKVNVIVRTEKAVTCERRYEADVERYLEDVGIRGVNDDAESFWELSALGTASIQRWRVTLGSRCDEFVRHRVLETAQLEVVRNVDAPEDLVVHEHDDGVMYGAGRHPEDGARVLTVSDVDGLKLVPDRLAKVVAEQLGCVVQIQGLDEGRVWLLGRKRFTDDVEPQIVLVLGAPSTQLRDLVTATIGDTPYVPLWPQGDSIDGEKGIAFRWDELSRTPGHIIDLLGVRQRLPLETQNPEGLAIGEGSGLLTFKGARVDLGAGSASHRFLLKLASAFPAKVPTPQLDEHLSPNRDDGAATRQAKSRLKQMLASAGLDIDDLVASGGGYGLKLPARVA